jgi:hypothetical protein
LTAAQIHLHIFYPYRHSSTHIPVICNQPHSLKAIWAICRFGHGSLCHSTWSPVSQIPDAFIRHQAYRSSVRHIPGWRSAAICQGLGDNVVLGAVNLLHIPIYALVLPSSCLSPPSLGLIDLIGSFCAEKEAHRAYLNRDAAVGPTKSIAA